jgi:hypothetical protein
MDEATRLKRNAKARERYASNPKYHEQKKERYASDPEYRERIRERALQKYRDIARLSDAYQNNPEYRAKRQVRDKSRINGSDMDNLYGEQCSLCGSQSDLQRHHPDYSSTDFFIVCRQCHNRIHREEKNAKT